MAGISEGAVRESTSRMPCMIFRVIGSLTMGKPVSLKFSAEDALPPPVEEESALEGAALPPALPDELWEGELWHPAMTDAAIAAAKTTAKDFFFIIILLNGLGLWVCMYVRLISL